MATSGDSTRKRRLSHGSTLTSASLGQILVHELNIGGYLEGQLFRLKKGWTVQFTLGPTLFGKKVSLFTNYPEKNETFIRQKYRKLEWVSTTSNKFDNTSLHSEVTYLLAGSFQYYFSYEARDALQTKKGGSGYFLVDPKLTYGTDDEVLPLDCIQCQTYLSKCLGPFNEWEDRLQVAKESGYNMIHLTPIQELGDSLSAYSLKDQHKINPMFRSGATLITSIDIGKFIKKIKEEWKVLTITDIVLNHTANESPWLKHHPECSYNLQNCPYMRPAFVLDCVFIYLQKEIEEGKWEFSGIPQIISEESHLQAIKAALHGYFLPKVKIHEFYMLDVDETVQKFKEHISRKFERTEEKDFEGDLKIIQDPEYRRYKSTINFDHALILYNPNSTFASTKPMQIQKCGELLRSKLEELNRLKQSEVQAYLNDAVDNAISGMRYERIADHGPKMKGFSKSTPLVAPYFTHFLTGITIEEEESAMYGGNGCYMMAHNGWVMGDDPLRNFAEEEGPNVYIKRELVAWGDSVKLRYGRKPDDCPFLWEFMNKYVQNTVIAFDGLRLDNCHSTPIHVAEFLIDSARKIKPDLYVIAELFTSSESIDNIFVNRLGISSLIRESMSAPDSHELGRLVYRYGGEPVGAFIQPAVRPLFNNIAHALFMDVTHDNPSPVQSRSVYDLLPSTALVAMACCASGSNRGYDELVPHHIHVVNENRHYQSWTTSFEQKAGSVNMYSGIIAGKKALNRLHYELGNGGFSQVYVDQINANVVAATRHCPDTHKSVILVAHTAFQHPSHPKDTGHIQPLCISGQIEEIILEGRLVSRNHIERKPYEKYLYDQDPSFINGITDYELHLKEHIQIYDSDMVELNSDHDSNIKEIEFKYFPPGSIIAFRVSLHSGARSSILRLRTSIAQFGYRARSYSGRLLTQEGNDFYSIISRFTLPDLNRVLFRCDAEEKDDGNDGGTYNVPNYGNLIYCGLQGIMTEFCDIHSSNDLSHPICENLRRGDWLPSYIANRLILHSSTKELGLWFKEAFTHLSNIPRYLIPCYFDTIITGAYTALLSAVWRNMSEFVSRGSNFVRVLALGSVIMAGFIESSPLPVLSPNLVPPRPTFAKSGLKENVVTLAAGLPHFTTGYMRNWGRDTFISLKGLFLIPGRYQETRYMILAYGGCLRHGLIPNLLDRGTNARYNCRDAVWWWLQCIQDYTIMVPDGHNILKDVVSRLYPTDESNFQKPGVFDQPLHDVIQESLQKHFQGIKFRERNAGRKIDSQMTDNGFNITIGVDPKTGFVYGGNENNCGTWMDKMGSSQRAGNKGKPATPRDGSAIELVGLCKSTLRWLNLMHQQGHYPYNSVEKKHAKHTDIITFEQWETLIQEHFEKYFWINTTSVPEVETHPELINRRGIYKDVVNSSIPWTEFQFRPNFAVAMVVAPELFNVKNALIALKNAEEILVGPLGMLTLDPLDWNYNGFYNNSDDSSDPKLANGFNYHNGPEWVWPLGYFLRAKLHFSKVADGGANLHKLKAVSYVVEKIGNHFIEVHKSKWRGLPELTNQNGSYCADSCNIQAWSHACILEVLYDLDNLFSS